MLIGFAAGVLLGMGDYLLLRVLSVTMVINGTDVTFGVVLLFAVTFGALGAVIARLWEQRRSLQVQAELIGEQLDELQKMKDALVEHETLAAVGRMSAGVAHEVRNPLSVIRSSAQMLAGDLQDDSAEAAEFICEEVDRLDDFVTRVLDFSRRVSVERQTVTWDELIGRLASIDAEFGGDDVQEFDLDPELTARLLASLVDNAHKSAGPHAHVVVCARNGGIEVVDDGPGVPAEQREEIFEPFFTTRAQGTGLGLAMARKLARLQGYDVILVDSDGGARFRFEPRPEFLELEEQ